MMVQSTETSVSTAFISTRSVNIFRFVKEDFSFSFSFFILIFPSYQMGSTSRRLHQQRLQTSTAGFLQGLARSQRLKHLPFPRLPLLQISGQKLFQIGSMEGFDTMRPVHSCCGNKLRYPPQNMLINAAQIKY